jgi:chemotaxis protein MotB
MEARMRASTVVVLAAVVAGLAGGCAAVSKEAYDRDMAGMKQQQDWLEEQKKGLDAQYVQCQGKVKISQDALQACTRDYQAASDELASTRKALEQCTTTRGSGAKELAACQIDRDKVANEAARLKAERDRLQAELGPLRDRLTKYENNIKAVRERLQKLVDGGKLRVKIANGFLVIEVSSDILFDLNKSDIKPTAKPVLQELATALAELPDRRFQVAGHTDNTGSAELNWRLSTARAVAVVEEIVKGGVNPATLSAGGYGPYLPVAANDSDEGRKKNRRVEFLLLPDLGDLFDLAK